MIQGIVTKPLRVIPDDRGWLVELLRSDDEIFRGFGQVYLTTVYPGVIKAWHLHERQTDTIVCIRGNIRLGLYDPREGSPTHGQPGELILGDLNRVIVQVPPGIFHGFACLGDETAFVLNIPDRLYDYDKPDEIRRAFDDPEIPFSWETENR